MTYLEELQSTLDTSKEMLILLVKRIELLSDEHFAYSEYEVNENDSSNFTILELSDESKEITE